MALNRIMGASDKSAACPAEKSFGVLRSSRPLRTLHIYFILLQLPLVMSLTSTYYQYGSDHVDALLSMKVGSNGYFYMCGKTYSDWGRTADGHDYLVAVADSSGALLSVSQPGTSGNDDCRNVALDDNDNAYTVGWQGNGVVIKYNSAGVLQWTLDMALSSGYAIGVATNAAGEVIAAGPIGGSLTGFTNAGSNDVFAQKYDADGNLIWSYQRGTVESDWAEFVAVDGSGNIIISGQSDGDFEGSGRPEGCSSGYCKMGFVVQLSNNGTENWVYTYQPTGTDAQTRVQAQPWFCTLDSSGATYCGGQMSAWESDAVFQGTTIAMNDYPGFFLKVDETGAFQWNVWPADKIRSLGYDSYRNHIIAGGYVSGPYPYLEAYDTNGNLLWDEVSNDIKGPVYGLSIEVKSDTIYAGVLMEDYDQSAPGTTSYGRMDFFIWTLSGLTTVTTSISTTVTESTTLTQSSTTSSTTSASSTFTSTTTSTATSSTTSSESSTRSSTTSATTSSTSSSTSSTSSSTSSTSTSTTSTSSTSTCSTSTSLTSTSSTSTSSTSTSSTSTSSTSASSMSTSSISTSSTYTSTSATLSTTTTSSSASTTLTTSTTATSTSISSTSATRSTSVTATATTATVSSTRTSTTLRMERELPADRGAAPASSAVIQDQMDLTLQATIDQQQSFASQTSSGRVSGVKLSTASGVVVLQNGDANTSPLIVSFPAHCEATGSAAWLVLSEIDDALSSQLPTQAVGETVQVAYRSQVVDVSVLKEAHGHVSVADIQSCNSIAIRLSASGLKAGDRCLWFDYAQMKWSKAGLEILDEWQLGVMHFDIDVPSDGVWCHTTHLSTFVLASGPGVDVTMVVAISTCTISLLATAIFTCWCVRRKRQRREAQKAEEAFRRVEGRFYDQYRHSLFAIAQTAVDDGAKGILILGIKSAVAATPTWWKLLQEDLYKAHLDRKAPFVDFGERLIDFSNIQFQQVAREVLSETLDRETRGKTFAIVAMCLEADTAYVEDDVRRHNNSKKSTQGAAKRILPFFHSSKRAAVNGIHMDVETNRGVRGHTWFSFYRNTVLDIIMTCMDEGASGLTMLGIQPHIGGENTYLEFPALEEDVTYAYKNRLYPFDGPGVPDPTFKRVKLEDLRRRIESETSGGVFVVIVSCSDYHAPSAKQIIRDFNETVTEGGKVMRAWATANDMYLSKGEQDHTPAPQTAEVVQQRRSQQHGAIEQIVQLSVKEADQTVHQHEDQPISVHRPEPHAPAEPATLPAPFLQAPVDAPEDGLPILSDPVMLWDAQVPDTLEIEEAGLEEERQRQGGNSNESGGEFMAVLPGAVS